MIHIYLYSQFEVELLHKMILDIRHLQLTHILDIIIIIHFVNMIQRHGKIQSFEWVKRFKRKTLNYYEIL